MGGKLFRAEVDAAYRTFVHGEGIYVFDAEGKRYLDAAAGVGVVSLGYGVNAISKAIYEQSTMIPFVHGLRFNNTALLELAEKVAEIAPPSLCWSFFVCGGSEAVETAIKLSRQYYLEIGKPTKYKVVGRWQGFHGNTILALSIGGHMGRRSRHTPLLADHPHIPPAYCYRCPFDKNYPGCQIDCAWALEETIQKEGADKIAAFIAEPIVGAAAGATVPPAEYFPIIRRICDKYDVLLIVDEVITGFGRTGRNFGFEHWAFSPDIIIAGKGISGGYAPLGAVIFADKIAEAFKAGSGRFEHNFTYAGNPISCRAGVAVLNIIQRENIVHAAKESGEYLFSLLERVKDMPYVGDVRGRGLLAGIELVFDKETKEPFPPEAKAYRLIDQLALEQGLIIYAGDGTIDGLRGDHFLLMPPLVITKQEIEEMIALLTETLKRFAAVMSSRTAPISTVLHRSCPQ
ncbi:MAG: aminotransferase class III-fold pyridoxal phosphate-dependent enzyme [Chloroflexi bacterium]|nr:aminotransferase class III-fold pyridoxal phosphate-dependent enzyme [Chloroflexota bacterium]MCL5075683.1 aminotransferase class III-fold pyridoxal phosphate-dependent enzyme [Chloroflexota bacterium]